MSTYPPGRLGIFARPPCPGQVKTRLSPPLTAEECAEFYRLSLHATVAAMSGFAPVLFHAGGEDYFLENFPGVELVDQGAGDLGARLQRAVDYLMSRAIGPAAIIGSDSPDLPPLLVQQALQALHNHDCAAIPAADGGYVLIGVQRALPELFADIPWSTAEVMAATRQSCRRSGLALAEIGGWADIDVLADLMRLLARAPQLAASRYAAACLQRHGVLPAASARSKRCGAQSANRL